jgi:DNA-binding NtrC family response regulator
MSAALLVIEDEAMLARSIKRSLAREGYTVELEESAEGGLDSMRRVNPDLILLDLRLPGMSGLEFLRAIREQGYEAPALVMSAHGAIQSAVEAMRLGAFDYIVKPLDLDELKLVVGRALEHAKVSQELAYYRDRDRREAVPGLPLGECAEMCDVRARIERIATLERQPGGGAPSVLVLGETGVGKGLVARAIHDRSLRAGAPFIDVHSGALPDTLLEAELFGYERGAFTDARGTRRGLFEAADRGTLFLDEVGHLSLSAQSKLLKVIEDRTFRRLGSTAERRVDVRIVAATNRDLVAAQASGGFLPELYHRLRVLTIDLPPLRKRGGDVIILAEHFLRHHARQYGLPPRPLSPCAREILLAHTWPGNVRELANEIERAVLLETGPEIGLTLLAKAIGASPPPVLSPTGPGRVEVHLPEGGIAFEAIERQVLLHALEMSGWTVTQAARLLRLSRDTFRYRMERLRIQTPPDQ